METTMLEAPQAQPSPFHPGEIQLQQAVGVSERMDVVGRRIIRDFMPDQHRIFYNQLPFAVLGSVDDAGDSWVTLVTGRPGFMHSPDAKTLSISVAANRSDPALAQLQEGDAIGLLGIELHTRRRNRMNGHISRYNSGALDITVDQSFGNCPQYIQRRDYTLNDNGTDAAPLPDTLVSTALDARARALITAADTFFVASYVQDERGRHVDASHRGGKAGFVRINADGSLTIPDFAGNLLFNTLGNILLNPKTGLVFPDFETGDMLHLTGDAEIVLESNEIAAFQGAERLWFFRPRQVVLRPGALALRWSLRPDGWSPNSLMTGDWDQARARLAADALKSQWRPFRIARTVDESSVIRSFYLQPADGNGIAPHSAGQHIPIRLTPDGRAEPTIRTYTLSTAPSDGQYRISVKRDGVVSRHLHDHLRVGDIIEVRAPVGGFTIDAQERRPAVLLAAGVGITPMLAMLRHIVYEGLRVRRVRPTWLFVSARTLAERAFDQEIAALVAQANGAVRLVRVLSDTTDALAEQDFDAPGRIDLALLRASLPFDGYDFYMCGPPGFMQSLYDQLRSIGAPDEHIHAEAFGPASLVRKVDGPTAQLPPPASKPVPVVFAQSGKEARWQPGEGTLLDLAESRGLAPDYSCRAGSCGTCATRILAGSVTYQSPPQAKVAEGTALICCALPAEQAADQDGRLVLEL
jgi:uncharacterized protein